MPTLEEYQRALLNAGGSVTGMDAVQAERLRQQRAAESQAGGQAVRDFVTGMLDPTDPLNYLGFGARALRAPLAIGMMTASGEAEAIPVGKSAKTFKSLPAKVEYDKYGNPFKEIRDDAASLNRETLKRLKTNYQKGIDYRSQTPVENITLEDVLNHPELYAAYPEIAKYPVSQASILDPSGWYNPKTKEIGIERELSSTLVPDKYFVSTLLHEATHAVQDLEKWAGGGMSRNIDSVRKADLAIYKAENAINAELDRVYSLGSPHTKYTYTDQSMLDDAKQAIKDYAGYKTFGRDWFKRYKSDGKPLTDEEIDNAVDVVNFWNKNTFGTKDKELVDKYAQVLRVTDKVKKKKDMFFEEYARLHGEAQARAVEKRFANPEEYEKPFVTSFDRPQNLLTKEQEKLTMKEFENFKNPLLDNELKD